MFIDIHAHAQKWLRPTRENGTQVFSTARQLLRQYDELGVERGVLLPIVSPECLPAQSTEEILDVATHHRGRFIPFCNLDPRSISNSPQAPLGGILRQYKEWGCKGIGEVTANLPFRHPQTQNLFKHVEATGFPLTFHIGAQIGGLYGLQDDPGLPQFQETLKRFPKLVFLCHGQTFWSEMAPLRKVKDRYGYPDYPIKKEGVVPKLFRKFPQMYGDLSAGSGHNALARDPKYALEFIHEFQDRLLFGLDICAPGGPTPLVGLMRKLLRERQISKNVFNKLARENAVRVLNLDRG